MTEKDSLDRILSSEDALVPSSGFAARVMGAVVEAASAPTPLPFPWGRFMLGVIAILVSVASGLWLMRGMESSSSVIVFINVWPQLAYATATFVASLGIIYAPRLRLAAHRLLTPGVSR